LAAHALDSLAAQAEHLSGLRFCRDLDLGMACQGGDFNLPAKCSGGETDRHFAMQIVAVALEYRVVLEMDHHIEVARRTAVDPGLALAAQTDAVAAVDPGRDLHRQGLVFLDAAFAMAGGAGSGHHLAGATAAR